MSAADSVFLLATATAWSQETMTPEEKLAKQRLQPRIGLFGDIGLNIHSGDFAGIPDAPTCIEEDGGSFTGGTAMGFAVGLLFELPLDPSWYLMARGGYYSMGAEQTVEVYLAPTSITRNDNSLDTASAISEYSFLTTLGMIGGEINIGFRPFTFPLTFRLGPEFGVFMQKDFSQKEQLVAPSSSAFRSSPPQTPSR